MVLFKKKQTNKQKTGAGNKAQQLRSLNILLEDWSLDPSIHIRWLTNTCSSSSKSKAPALTLSGTLHSPLPTFFKMAHK